MSENLWAYKCLMFFGFGLIGEKHNSNDLIGQVALEGESVFEFELIGVVTLDGLAEKREPPPNAGEKWTFTLFDKSRN